MALAALRTISLAVVYSLGGKMARVKMRFKLPRKETGIVLEQLESFLADSRKFLISIAEDLQLPDPSAKWLGLEFRNASISYTAEYPLNVQVPQNEKFNDAVLSRFN